MTRKLIKHIQHWGREVHRLPMYPSYGAVAQLSVRLSQVGEKHAGGAGVESEAECMGVREVARLWASSGVGLKKLTGSSCRDCQGSSGSDVKFVSINSLTWNVGSAGQVYYIQTTVWVGSARFDQRNVTKQSVKVILNTRPAIHATNYCTTRYICNVQVTDQLLKFGLILVSTFK